MADIRNALPALALSLVEDPFYQAITVAYSVTRDRQLQVLERYFEYSLFEAQRTGRCTLAPDESQGAAAWLLPRSVDVETAESSAKESAMSDILGRDGSGNYRSIIQFMTTLAGRHVPADAWYLSIVGVHPNARGRGLGQALLQTTLHEASNSGRVCYLETFTKRNISFYSRLGFATVADYVEPLTGCNYFVMRRDA